MNELKIIIKAVTTDAQKNMQAVKKELQGISKEAKGTSEKFGTAMKGIAKAVTVAITAVTAVVAAIAALGKSTLDFQKQQAQLVAAFQASGKSAKDAASVYKDFFRFLGDSDTAIEASNLLIKLTQDEKNLTQWTKILQGVYATFPDSLPIEGLVESANETARVGQVTGNLADALNWAGASEDAFNAQLAQTTSLEEREALIRNTLNGLYGRAAQLYEQNNQALLEYNESQANFQQSAAALGATITPLLTYLNNLGATVMSVLKPAFETVLPYIAGFVLWLTEAISRAAIFSGMLSGTSDAVESAGNAMSGSFSSGNDTLKETKKELDAIKKATMGFDELNVVSSGQTSTGNSGNSGNTGAANGGIPSFEGLTSVAGSIEDFKKKTEAVRDSIQAWMDDWGWALKGIASILAALSVRHLIIQFGELVGLADKFKAALSFTGIIAGVKELVGWFGAVIGLLKEGNSFWAVMGAAFPNIAKGISAIGAAFSKAGGAIASAAKAVVAFVGGLSASTIAIIVAAVVALASAVYFLWENWEAVCAKVREFCELNIAPIFEEFKNSFSQLWEAIKSVGQAFADLGLLIWNALPEGVKEWFANAAAAIRDVVVAIGEWFASIDWLKAIGTVFEWLGGIIVGIVGGVIAGAIQGVLNLIESAVQIITGIVQVVAGLVSGLVNLIVALFTGDFSKALDSVKMIWEGIKNVFKGAVDAVIGTVWGFIEGIIDFFVHMWDVLVGHSIVPDTIEAIIEWFAYLPIKVFELVAGFVEGVINFFADLAVKIGEWAVTIWNNIVAAFKAAPEWFAGIFAAAWAGIQNAWSTVVGWFSNIWAGIQKVFANVASWFTKIFTDAWNGIKSAWSGVTKWFSDIWSSISNTFKDVGNWFGNKFTDAKNGVQNAFKSIGSWFGSRWSDVKSAFNTAGSWFGDTFKSAYSKVTGAFSNAKSGFSNIWSNIKAGFGNVSGWFKDTFTTAWTNVKNVFSSGGKIFDGIKDGILSGLKNVVNGIINGINKVVKTPFDGINSALSKLKGVEIVGIKPFSWLPTINVPQIPQLAKGGIVDQATLALIGERGKEAVVPLENNTEWIDKLVDKLTSRQQAPSKIVLMLDGKELGWANINSINNITRQTGALQLTLV